VNQRVSDNEDVKIGDYIIPKGTNVNIPNCVIFADERWFGKNPEQFRPERFMGDSEEAERARKSWIPFGEHTRMCIGQTFALAEMKVIIHSVVTRASVELENPNDPGEVMIEAGVNQPSHKQRFIFRARNLGKLREEENLKWWMAQIDALEKIKPTGGEVAHVA
jgi:cytochrome P450